MLHEVHGPLFCENQDNKWFFEEKFKKFVRLQHAYNMLQILCTFQLRNNNRFQLLSKVFLFLYCFNLINLLNDEVQKKGEERQLYTFLPL